MEHFKSPFVPGDFGVARVVENRRFFEETLRRAKSHRFFSHPFMSSPPTEPSREVTSFILTSFYKIVSPFTGLLCALGGRAPDLRSRFALMDNIYEEMGCGDLSAAHPSLYLKMLESIGVTQSDAENARTLPSIRRINEHLHDVVHRRSFAVACAVLASAEATIPPSFPILARMAQSAFPDVDMTFFDRHGPRDDGHADDAGMLFALSADSVELDIVSAEVESDLDFRAELFDEWMAAIERGVPVVSQRVHGAPMPTSVSERPPRFASERPPRIPGARRRRSPTSVPPPA